MKHEDVHGAWAPGGSPWSLFVKPVLFAQASFADATTAREREPDVSWAASWLDGTAFVVDLPGHESVALGAALAAQSIRPVPLFNACTDPANEVVPQGETVRALFTLAPKLAERLIAPTSLPAFLLDAHRQAPARPLRPGAFDNRSRVFADDFPSPGFLREHGVRRAVLVRRAEVRPEDDLVEVLVAWREAGIELFAKRLDEAGPPRPCALERATWLARFWLALRSFPARDRSGAFGEKVPSFEGRSHG
jgi:hypothetical protein